MKCKAILKLCATAVCAVMLFGVGTVMPETMREIAPVEITAQAADLVDDYPAYYKSYALDAIVDEWKYYNRECTSFVAWRLNSRNGVAFHNWYGGVNFGNAATWGGAARSIGITVDMNPAPGSVFWQDDGGYGHVAWVNSVNGDGTVTIEEYNWNWDGAYHYRTVAVGLASGYIHIKDLAASTPQGHVMSESEAAGQTIPDGEYHIMSELNQNYGLACGGRTNTESGTNVWLNNWGDPAYGVNLENIGKTDTWKVTYLNNGFYRIQQNGVNVSLDVSGGDLHRGTNVQVWENHNDTPEQWSINKTDHGYTIQARCNAYYLDVDGGIVENGRNVQVWEGNNSKAQSWCFIPAFPEQTVTDGLYRIHSAVDDEYVLDASGNIGEYKEGSNIQVWDSGGDDVFQITHDVNGYYYISELSSGLVLDVNLSDSNYLNVHRNIALFGKADQRNKKWEFSKNSDGTYCIFSQLSGYPLDLALWEDGINNGDNVCQYPYHGRANQCWTLEPVELESIKVDQLPDKTTYFIDERFDPTGIVVNAKYSGDYSFEIAKGVTYDYDFSTPGEQTVTAQYEINGVVYTDKFTVTVNSIDFKGSGTKSDPYLIENKADLKKMRDLINSEDYLPAFGSCYYLQTADIDLSGEVWIPIAKCWSGDESIDRNFSGHYDGGQHWIYGLNVEEETKFTGLFGRINNNAVIENLAVDGSVSGEDSVGGIAGEIQNATISNCCFIGDVSGKKYAVGGIVGYMWQSGIVQNCYHIGSVTTSEEQSAGGIVGIIQSNEVKNAVCTVENCYHVGVMEKKTYTGTLIGCIDKVDTDVGQKISLINCYGLTDDDKLCGGSQNPDVNTAKQLKASVLKMMAPTLGEAYVKNYDNTYLEGYPIFQWQTRLKGDVNADGEFSVADVVLLQKWLLAVPDTYLSNWKAADFYEDEKLNVFDLCVMKSEILKK